MLLNEVHREHSEIEALQHHMQEMEAELAALSARHWSGRFAGVDPALRRFYLAGGCAGCGYQYF